MNKSLLGIGSYTFVMLMVLISAVERNEIKTAIGCIVVSILFVVVIHLNFTLIRLGNLINSSDAIANWYEGKISSEELTNKIRD